MRKKTFAALLCPVPEGVNGKVEAVPGRDYEVTYENNVELGTASLTVTGIGNYSGSKKIEFHIYPFIKKISDCDCSLMKSQFTYNGNPRKPGVKVVSDAATLVKNTDYAVSYNHNVKAGNSNYKTVTKKVKLR